VGFICNRWRVSLEYALLGNNELLCMFFNALNGCYEIVKEGDIVHLIQSHR